MIKVVFFTTIVALVVGDEFTDKLNEKMRGDWTPVKIFPPVPVKRNAVCYATNNTVVDDYCKCGGKLVPQLKRSNHLLTNQLPIIIVETEQELQEGYNATCQCKDTDVTSEQFGEFVPFPNHMMIRFASDNYFIAYDKDYRDRKPYAFALVLAREVPTTIELERFLSKIDYIKGEQGRIICTKPEPLPPGWADSVLADLNSTIQRIESYIAKVNRTKVIKS